MCWNRNVSLVAAAWGWVACALLAYRGGRNDRWYALYLFTFTLTQVIDAVLWSLQYDRGLEACDGRRMSFAVGAPDGQLANLIVSKYAIPAVVIIQYAAQLAYPSSRNPRLRRVMLLGYVAAGVVMCYTSGCTDVIRAKFPEPHSTLRWGGTRTPALPILLVAAATIANFFVVIDSVENIASMASGAWSLISTQVVDDRIVLAVLVVPFLCVITILWTTEGTLALGSKWCTYCLIYSILFLAAPLWDVRRWKDDDQAPGAARDEETTESFSGWSVGGSTEETKEGDIESLVAAEERGRKQARDDDVEEGWNRFVAEQSGELG